MHGKLHIGSAAIDSDGSKNIEGSRSHNLILSIREGLNRRHGDTVSGMNPHGIDVFDGTDDHGIVFSVPHHFQLELLPPDEGLLDQSLAHHAFRQSPLHQVLEIGEGVCDAAALASQGKAGSDYEGQARFIGHLQGSLRVSGDQGSWNVQADIDGQLFEGASILGDSYRLHGGSDHLDTILREDSAIEEVEGKIEGRLTAHRGKDRIGAFLPYDFFHILGKKGLHVHGISQSGSGHYRGRIRVNQQDVIALLFESTNRLGPGIIELAGLSDYDGTGADYQYLIEVIPARHSISPVLSARGSA